MSDQPTTCGAHRANWSACSLPPDHLGDHLSNRPDGQVVRWLWASEQPMRKPGSVTVASVMVPALTDERLATVLDQWTRDR